MNCLITYMFKGFEHEKYKVQVPQWNEMLSLYMLHLLWLVKMKNIIPSKIYLTVGIWKMWCYKKLLGNRK